MKRRTVQEEVEFEDGLLVRWSRTNSGRPESVTIQEVGDGGSVSMSCEALERTAAVVRRARQDTDWTSEVCEEHGYFNREGRSYECPQCYPERAAEVTS